MISIRVHGRGGQGVITAAELIALAGFKSGLQTQALPAFGVERTGAPIQAFARLSDKPILTREHIYEPQIIIVQDPTLLESLDIMAGANQQTKLIVNSPKTAKGIFNQIKSEKIQSLAPMEKNITTVDASSIAFRIFGKNLVNTALLGALAKTTKQISITALKAAITEKFTSKGQATIDRNITAALETFK